MGHVLLFSIFVAAGVSRAQRPSSWRDALMQQARLRTLNWYADKSQLEVPQMKDGVAVRMMKEDRQCGGQAAPVIFFEFEVQARPVDVFNALASDPTGKKNPCGNSVTESAGEFPEGGIRAWKTLSQVPMMKEMAFVQWEVVDANFKNDTFWLVTSTLQNEVLLEKSPLEPGVQDADACLVSWFFDALPIAWDLTFKCTEVLRRQSQLQGSLQWAPDQTVLPRWMLDAGLHGATVLDPPGITAWDTAWDEKPQTGTSVSDASVLTMMLLLFVVCCCISLCGGRSAMRSVKRRGGTGTFSWELQYIKEEDVTEEDDSSSEDEEGHA